MKQFPCIYRNLFRGLDYMNGMEFTIYDRDQDHGAGNCAQIYQGAWWYASCYDANPNGKYLTPGTNDQTSMNYLAFRSENLRTIKLMFR